MQSSYTETDRGMAQRHTEELLHKFLNRLAVAVLRVSPCPVSVCLCVTALRRTRQTIEFAILRRSTTKLIRHLDEEPVRRAAYVRPARTGRRLQRAAVAEEGDGAGGRLVGDEPVGAERPVLEGGDRFLSEK